MGKRPKEIAFDLAITESTVWNHLTTSNKDNHTRSIRERLGFSDPCRITHFAIQFGLVKAGEFFR